MACQSSMAALPVAKSATDWLAAYSALPGAVILSLAMKSMYCLTAVTASGVVKVGLPEASKKSAPCCLPKTKAWWTFSDRLPPSTARPYLPPLVSFLPSATSSSQVAGGLAMPASANIFLL